MPRPNLLLHPNSYLLSKPKNEQKHSLNCCISLHTVEVVKIMLWQSHSLPGRQFCAFVISSEPQNDQEHPQNRRISPSTFSKGLKSCRGGPKFSPRPNLPLHPISSTSRQATPHIRDPLGPIQTPKMTKNTPKRDAYPLAPLKVIKIMSRRP